MVLQFGDLAEPRHISPQPMPFIGREEELADITRLLADPACALMTLIGPGGIGKTRLSIRAAGEVTGNFEALQISTKIEFIPQTLAILIGVGELLRVWLRLQRQQPACSLNEPIRRCLIPSLA